MKQKEANDKSIGLLAKKDVEITALKKQNDDLQKQLDVLKLEKNNMQRQRDTIAQNSSVAVLKER